MRNLRLKAAPVILMVVAVMGLYCPVHAQEVVTDNAITVGARSLGMGGAQIAAVEDVTAVIHNPERLDIFVPFDDEYRHSNNHP